MHNHRRHRHLTPTERHELRVFLTAGVIVCTLLALLGAYMHWTWAGHTATGLGLLVNVRWIWS